MDRNNQKWSADRLTESRRGFLRSLAGGLSAGAAIALAGCQTSNPKPSGGSTLLPRRSISSLQQSDPNNILQTFENGVQSMKNRNDDRSWSNIASIHGNWGGFNHCEHGTDYFLPWHRAYLAFFEDIIRELTGVEEFALPYWNWAKNPSVPSMFQNPSSPLHNSSRSNDPHPDGPSTDQAAVERVLNLSNFFNFTYDLETPPHDMVHVDVGGDMALPQSPLDPLFWVHHCMVDCIWLEWNARGNPNPSASSWTSTAFTDEFVDRHGNSVSEITVDETLWTPFESHAMYEVDDKGTSTPDGVQPPSGETWEEYIRGGASEPWKEFYQQGAEIDIETEASVTIEEDLVVEPGEMVEVPVETDEIAEFEEFVGADESVRFQLTLDDIVPPGRSGATTRLFVDQPEPIVETPREDPRFAGSQVFFVEPNSEMRPTTRVGITDTFNHVATEEELFERDEFAFQFASDPDEGVFENLEGFNEEELRGQSYTVGQLDFEVTQSVITDNPLDESE